MTCPKLGTVRFEYFGQTVYLTFENYITGDVYSRFYKTEGAAKAAATRFHNKLVREYLNA